MRWTLIFSGFLALLSVSYLDNIRGPLLPVLRAELNASPSMMSWFLISANISSVVMNTFMLPLLRKYSERVVVIGLCAFAVAVGTFAGQIRTQLDLILFALSLGILNAPMSSLANIFVVQGTDPKHRSKLFCGLHMNYALGSILAPWAVSIVLNLSFPWYYAFYFASFCFVGLIFFYSTVLSRRVEAKIVEAPHARKKLTRFEKGICFGFSIYVVGEVLGSMWIASYLVESMGMSPEVAARYSVLFFVVMGLSRLYGFVFLKPSHEKIALIGCLVVAIVVFSIGHLFKIPWAFSCYGMLGPFFPVFMARVTKAIPERSDTFAVTVLTLNQVAVASGHILMGKLTELVGISYSYWLPIVFIGLVLLMIPVYFRWESRQLKV